MGTPSKQLREFMEKYNVDSDEIWEVRAGGAWAIKHVALERIAVGLKIVFDRPAIVEAKSGEKTAVVCVFGTLGDRTEWSFGEASPANNKNAYCFSMAEKRGKDRVILKLLNAHGHVYSEDEADDFARVEGKMATLPKKDAKEIYTKMQREVRECASRKQLKEWMNANKDRIQVLPEDWQDILRLQCEEMMADLRNKEAA